MSWINWFKSFVYQNSPSFLFKSLAHSGNVITDLKQYGFAMILNLEDYAISRPILLKGTYEQNVTKVLLRYLKPDLHFLDIGANLGYYSLLVASQCPQAKIYSFEPDQDNFHLFTSSIVYNQFQDRIHAYPLAVSDTNKSITLSNLGNQGNYGARFTAESKEDLTPYIHGENPYFREISAVSLDQFLPDIALDLVKIDIEGHEPWAIQGMINLLKQNQPLILAEFAPSNLQNLGKTDPQSFLELILNLGYTLNCINRNGELLSYEQKVDRFLKDFHASSNHHLDLLFLPMT